MRVIAIGTLRSFWARHPGAEQPLRAWYHEARLARWASPHDVKAAHRTASLLGGGRAVFNIGGNRYRLVVKINYPLGIVFIRFVGTHAQYDRIDAGQV